MEGGTTEKNNRNFRQDVDEALSSMVLSDELRDKIKSGVALPPKKPPVRWRHVAPAVAAALLVLVVGVGAVAGVLPGFGRLTPPAGEENRAVLQSAGMDQAVPADQTLTYEGGEADAVMPADAPAPPPASDAAPADAGAGEPAGLPRAPVETMADGKNTIERTVDTSIDLGGGAVVTQVVLSSTGLTIQNTRMPEDNTAGDIIAWAVSSQGEEIPNLGDYEVEFLEEVTITRIYFAQPVNIDDIAYVEVNGQVVEVPPAA